MTAPNQPSVWPEIGRGDFEEAWDTAGRDCRVAKVATDLGGDPCPKPAVDEVLRVHERAVSWHGGRDNDETVEYGSELDLVAVLELVDGRWAALYGWNDYTGWGCQDGAGLRIGDTREQVIRWGLDRSQRQRLGLEVDGEQLEQHPWQP